MQPRFRGEFKRARQEVDQGVIDLRNGSFFANKLIDIRDGRNSLVSDLIRVAVRFFSGVPHPHLLGVCCPNHPFLLDPRAVEKNSPGMKETR